MPDEQQSSTSIVITTPLAIIIAGALIAAGLYFGLGGDAGSLSAKTADSGRTVQGTPRPTAAAQPAGSVGEMREVSDDDHIRGASNPKVTIVEYSDLECPFCKRHHATLMQVLEQYPDDVAWVYRHAPLVQLHSKAPAEANAAECAGEQGKFWEFVDLVFETTNGNDSLDLDTMPDLAQQAGVPNISQFETCVETEKYKDVVDADLADAQSAGLRGTPYSVAIGPDGEKRPISGAVAIGSITSTIDALLE